MTLSEVGRGVDGRSEAALWAIALMYIIVLDYTVISTLIVATGACDGHKLLNEHENVMTGFMELNTDVPSTFNYLTSSLLQVQWDFLDGKISVKWSNLFTHYQQVLDQEKLPVYLCLQETKKNKKRPRQHTVKSTLQAANTKGQQRILQATENELRRRDDNGA